jgi:hypothetical protein
MLRLVLELVLMLVVARAFWRVLGRIVDGVAGRRGGGSQVPDRGVPMVRDPVCGTFVLPDRAIALADGGRRVFFCSTGCRDAYRARSGTGRWGPREA